MLVLKFVEETRHARDREEDREDMLPSTTASNSFLYLAL